MKKGSLSNKDIALRTAATLFLTKGYQVTSMDEIVAASKVSKTNIYYHYKNKEELLLAVVDRLIARYEQRIAQIVSSGDTTIPDKIARLIDVLTEEGEQRDYLGGCPFLTIYTQTSGESELLRSRIKSFFERQLLAVEQLLAEGRRTQQLRQDIPVRQTAALIVTSIEGALFVTKASDNPAVLQDLIDALAAMLK